MILVEDLVIGTSSSDSLILSISTTQLVSSPSDRFFPTNSSRWNCPCRPAECSKATMMEIQRLIKEGAVSMGDLLVTNEFSM